MAEFVDGIFVYINWQSFTMNFHKARILFMGIKCQSGRSPALDLHNPTEIKTSLVKIYNHYKKNLKILY